MVPLPAAAISVRLAARPPLVERDTEQALGRVPWGGGESMQYYDPERDGPVDGMRFSTELVAFLSEITSKADEGLELSPEGLAGLSGILAMIHQCLADISRQLRVGSPEDSQL